MCVLSWIKRVWQFLGYSLVPCWFQRPNSTRRPWIPKLISLGEKEVAVRVRSCEVLAWCWMPAGGCRAAESELSRQPHIGELQLGYNSRKMRNPAEESCFNNVFCLIINCSRTGDSSASWLTGLLSSLWLYFLRIFCISSQVNRNVLVGLCVPVFSLTCYLWSLTRGPLSYTGFMTSVQWSWDENSHGWVLVV